MFGTEGQICQALLLNIATHPRVTNTRVQWKGKNYSFVNFRLFGGEEFIEEGLTLAVFPNYSSYLSTSGDISNSVKDKSIYYKYNDRASSLGAPNSYPTPATLQLVVQVYLRDSTFNDAFDLSYEYALPSVFSLKPHGDSIQFIQGLSKDEYTPLANKTNEPTSTGKLKVRVHPGEEILRSVMPILRAVIRSIPKINPFNVTNPTIMCVDYPTTNWSNLSRNLVFHTAYILVEYDLQESLDLSDYDLPYIQEMSLTAERISLDPSIPNEREFHTQSF